VPYGTASQLDVFPGNKLPGYDHLIPPGQSPTSPSGTGRLIGKLQAVNCLDFDELSRVATFILSLRDKAPLNNPYPSPP